MERGSAHFNLMREKFWRSTGQHVVARRPVPKSSVINIDGGVVRYLKKRVQKSTNQLEAGGQLFGNVYSGDLKVEQATGPYKSDQRGRGYYCSCPVTAQKKITLMAEKGFLYVGEWHSHAESKPQISYEDRNAIKKIWSESTLNTNQLILLIIGNNSVFDWHIASVSQNIVTDWYITK